MPLLLQDVQFADGPAICNIHISAFFDDPFQQTLFPNMTFEKQLADMNARWPGDYGDTSFTWKKVVDTNSGEIVGYSKWAFMFTRARGGRERPSDIPDDIEVQASPNPEGRNDAFAEKFANQVTEVRDRALELKGLAVLPSHQRRGVGALQLTWATELADEKGLTCWLQGSPAAVALYRKFGYELKGEIVSMCHDINGVEAPHVSTLMMRLPKAEQS
ncbi:hypothetical protein BKA65DRAFT_29898 [Rhexocercosporidium sp. MPI-PUGE-AT-0058]|nr:hypothetical protein BKA65DRAFT_29898 [Rhexocercosporidium sp. MPI-PUGE-AT-0058]